MSWHRIVTPSTAEISSPKCESLSNGTEVRFAFTVPGRVLHPSIGRRNEEILKSKSTPLKHVKHTSADAFRLATLGGAEALNLSQQIGTIQVGKKADMIIYDAASLNLAGIHDPIQGIVFHASNADIDVVFVDGEIVVDKRIPGKVGLKGGIQWKDVARELRVRADELRGRWPLEKLEETWGEFYAATGGSTY